VEEKLNIKRIRNKQAKARHSRKWEDNGVISQSTVSEEENRNSAGT